MKTKRYVKCQEWKSQFKCDHKVQSVCTYCSCSCSVHVYTQTHREVMKLLNITKTLPEKQIIFHAKISLNWTSHHLDLNELNILNLITLLNGNKKINKTINISLNAFKIYIQTFKLKNFNYTILTYFYLQIIDIQMFNSPGMTFNLFFN